MCKSEVVALAAATSSAELWRSATNAEEVPMVLDPSDPNRSDG